MGLSPSDPDVRGAIWPDVLGVGALSAAGDLGLWCFSPEFPGLTPRFSSLRVFAPQIADIRDLGPSLSKPGSLFYRGSGPCGRQYPGFTPRAFESQISSPRSALWGSDPTARNPGVGSCRPRGGGLDREVRPGCHPFPSRGGFPGPPLGEGESRGGGGGEGRGLPAPRPAWPSRWRTPGGVGSAGAP